MEDSDQGDEHGEMGRLASKTKLKPMDKTPQTTKDMRTHMVSRWADLEDTEDEEEEACIRRGDDIKDNYKALEMETG